MELHILRHAIAVERGTPGYRNDFDRPLTPDGEKKLKRITRAMRNLGLTFDLIISSPYVRARQTAEAVAVAFGARKRLELHDALGVDGNPRELIAELRTRAPSPDSVLLVGHEPYLTGLITLLVVGNEKACLRLKKGGLCKLTAEPLRPGRCAVIEWLLTPRQMLLMA